NGHHVSRESSFEQVNVVPILRHDPQHTQWEHALRQAHHLCICIIGSANISVARTASLGILTFRPVDVSKVFSRLITVFRCRSTVTAVSCTEPLFKNVW